MYASKFKAGIELDTIVDLLESSISWIFCPTVKELKLAIQNRREDNKVLTGGV